MPPLLFILWTHNRVESKDALGRTKTPHLQIASTDTFLFAVSNCHSSFATSQLPFFFSSFTHFFFVFSFVFHPSPVPCPGIGASGEKKQCSWGLQTPHLTIVISTTIHVPTVPNKNKNKMKASLLCFFGLLIAVAVCSQTLGESSSLLSNSLLSTSTSNPESEVPTSESPVSQISTSTSTSTSTSVPTSESPVSPTSTSTSTSTSILPSESPEPATSSVPTSESPEPPTPTPSSSVPKSESPEPPTPTQSSYPSSAAKCFLAPIAALLLAFALFF